MNIIEKIAELEIPVVQAHGTFSSAESLLEFTRPLIGVEGFVVDFGGHKLKSKAEQYCRIHRVKDKIRSERNILALIMNEELDDVLPIIDVADAKKVKDYEKMFDNAFVGTMDRIGGLVDLAKVLHGGDRKEVALNFMPFLIHKQDAAFIFRVFDGKDLRTMMIDHVKKNMNNDTKYDELVKWMDMK